MTHPFNIDNILVMLIAAFFAYVYFATRETDDE